MLVMIPVLFLIVALTASIFGIELTLHALGSRRLSPAQSVALQEVRLLVVGLGSVGAAIFGALVAVAIRRPLRQLVRAIQSRIDVEIPVKVATAVSELADLSNAFDNMLLSFDKFVSDSHILEGMPLGVILVDGQNRITRTNAEARRLLKVGAGSPEGDAVEKLLPSPIRSLLWEALARVRETGEAEELSGTLAAPAMTPDEESSLQVNLFPAGPPGEVLVTLKDLSQIPRIRNEIRRVDQLAAVGIHVASLAHEVNGSLMAVQTMLDLLSTEGQQDRLRQRLQEEINRASRLMDEIRAFGRDRLSERTPCRLGELLRETLSVARERFRKNDVEIVERVSPDLPSVLGDSDRLAQALTNILTNAFEATPPSGKIRVTAEREGGDIVVRVANTGSYISPDDQKKIFNLFYTTKRRGSGFGLPLAQRTITDHGGSIAVESSPDNGTEFVIRLAAS